MKPETLEALRGSIAKWQGIVAGTQSDQGTSNCPLCQKFNGMTEETDLGCEGCPVNEKTGKCGCKDSPYDMWADHDHYDGQAITAKQKELAQAELDFLISLLPAEESVDAAE